ncbi:MAG: ABC transporter substrate binding protein [Synergistaceae bacterium]
MFLPERLSLQKNNLTLHSINRITFIVLLVVIMFFTRTNSSYAADKEGIVFQTPQVLILSSYNYDWESNPIMLKAIEKKLKGFVKTRYIFMDTKYSSYDEIKQNIANDIDNRMSHGDKYDYVITLDDYALHFVEEYREKFFKGIPIIFEGINDVQYAKKMAKDPLITGIIETFPLQQTIQLALTVNPKAKRVVAITDDTLSGKGSSKQFYKCSSMFPNLSFETINTSKFKPLELAKKISKLRDDTILILLTMTRDVNDKNYSVIEAVEFVSNYSNIPVYKADELGIGHGVLGGIVVSYKEMATEAADIILHLSNGEKIAEIPLRTAHTECKLDAVEIERFGISKNFIPDNYEERVVFVNTDKSFMEKHFAVIFPALIIFYLMAIIIIVIYIAQSKNKKISEELKEKTIMTDKLLQNIPGGIGIYRIGNSDVIDVERLYVSEGLLNITGLSIEKHTEILEEKKYSDVLYTEDVPELIKALKEDAPAGLPINIKFRIKHARDTLKWVSLSATQIKKEENSNIYYAVFMDVTSQILAEKREEETRVAKAESQAKTRFLSIVSHDMRTPLNGILGLTDILLAKTKEEETKEDLLYIENAGRYLLNLINDTLDMNKIESGLLELRPTVCDGRTLMKSVLALTAPLIEKKKITVNTHIGNLPFTKLFIDIGRFEQVLMNLIGNAVKFSPEGSTLDFYMKNISVENGIITDKIIIKDHGIGMSKEFLPNIFEPFAQEERDCDNHKYGSGLGMGITKKIIEAMGGEIQIESELNVGTTVTIILPLIQATKEQIEEATNKKINSVNLDNLIGKRILLCEDVSLNVKIATAMLTGKGIIVDVASNGKDGVELFDKSEEDYYDAILMDIRMPIMDGYQATKAIRELERNDAKNVPIIALTANAFDTDVHTALEAGMNAHISKPIEPMQLYSTIASLIETAKKTSSEQAK